VSDKILNSTFFLVFRFKGYLLRKLGPSLLVVIVPTTVIVLLHEFTGISLSTNFSLPGLMGAALGVLLVFRNNTAYERWWEARKVLGALVNTSRSFALLVSHLLPRDKHTHLLARLIAAFPYALKGHLRDGVLMDEISFLDRHALDKVERWRHKPNAIADEMVCIIKEKCQLHQLTDYQMVKLLDMVGLLVDILGKCERIRKTPIPMAHNYLLKVYIVLYALVMPFGFVETMHGWTVVAVAAVYYVAMSIVAIAEEIEDPFGTDANDLPVDGICANIHTNIKEIYTDHNTYN